MKIKKTDKAAYTVKLSTKEAKMLREALNTLVWGSLGDGYDHLMTDLYEGLDGNFEDSGISGAKLVYGV